MIFISLDVEYLIHVYTEQKEELLKTSKLSWHDQDVERLLRITLNPLSPFAELERTITKAQESELLGKFNKIVERIAEQERIDPVLFFSKKAQKDFLRMVFIEGLDVACNEITSWRSGLIKKEILTLLR